MNFKIIKTSLLCFLLPGSVLAQSDIIRVTGTLDPSHNGEKIIVMYGSMQKLGMDTARVKDGKVVFNLKDAAHKVINMSMGTAIPRDQLSLYVADSDISFRAADSLKYAEVTGNQLSADYSRMNAPLANLTAQRLMYMRKLNSIPADQRDAAAALYIKARVNALSKAEKATAYRAADENPDSYISLLMLKSAGWPTPVYEEVMPHFSKLSKAVRATDEAKLMEAKLMEVKGLRSGLKAGNFESATPEGKKLSLTEITSKSKYTLVDFWASWCIPCRAENPNVVRAYQQFSGRGLSIISVSLDTKAELWKAAIVKDGMPWLHVSTLTGFNEPAAKLYNIKVIPQNVLVDQNGVIVATNLRSYALIEKLKELLP